MLLPNNNNSSEPPWGFFVRLAAHTEDLNDVVHCKIVGTSPQEWLASLWYSQTWTTPRIFKTIYRPRIWVLVLVFKRLNIFSFSFACLLFSFFFKIGWYLHKRKACFAKSYLFLFFGNIEVLCSKRPEIQPELSSKQPGIEKRYRPQQLNPLLLLFQSTYWLAHANYVSGIQGK